MKNKITKEELDLYIYNINAALENDIDDIKNFGRSDIIHLEKLMLLNLRNSKKYDVKVLKISKKLSSMYEKEERLIHQASYTRSIIVDESEYNIKKSILALTIFALVSSNTMIEFIKKILILLFIDSIAFNLNVAYFTSDERKKFVKRKLEKLKNNIINEENYYKLYKEINRCFISKLDVQYEKLQELYPEIEEENIKIRKKK